MRHLQSRYGVIASSVVVAPFLTYTWPKGIGPVSWEATPVAAAAAVAAAASAAAPLASAALERIRSNEIISRGACGARVGEDTRDSWRGEVGRETPAPTLLTWRHKEHVSYATCSPALSQGGRWRTTPAPAAFPMWGYVRQVSYATSSPAPCHKGADGVRHVLHLSMFPILGQTRAFT